VENRNGLRAIQQNRILSALGTIASEGTKIATAGTISPLTEPFEKSVGDVVSTVINNSYSREQERRADQSAIALLQRVGYDPGALTTVLHGMPDNGKVTENSVSRFSRSHPKMIERIRYLETDAGITSSKGDSGKRQKRFKRFTSRV
jgi:predicted Zn-dependent protease